MICITTWNLGFKPKPENWKKLGSGDIYRHAGKLPLFFLFVLWSFSPIVPRFIFVALNAKSSPNLLHVKSRIVVKCSRAEVHKPGPHADIRAGRKQGIFTGSEECWNFHHDNCKRDVRKMDLWNDEECLITRSNYLLSQWCCKYKATCVFKLSKLGKSILITGKPQFFNWP